ncbi:MAG: NAD(P)-dependent oxidoreductase [Calditrichaeota bacterium]|nr:NAD(P)-dependent oxidoreductase [Calditrichota bacterium]
MKIGFIGLGIMGSRMAAHLLEKHPGLRVWNRSPEKAETLLAAGAVWADSPADFKEVEVLFTMLAHPDAVSALAFGERGFLQHLKPGAIWVDCSTGNPDFSREMATAARGRGIAFVDAPVAGTRPHAENRELVIFASGDAQALPVVEPLLGLMGKKVMVLGEAGQATSLKVVINMMLGISMAAFAEAVTLGEQMGLSRQLLMNALIGGPVAAPFLGMKRPMIEAENYPADFPLEWMHKDMLMARIAAGPAGELPLSEAAEKVYGKAREAGLGRSDFAAVFSFLKG